MTSMEFQMDLTAQPAFLQRCLEAGHMNLKELAHAAGLSTRTISRWINGAGGVMLPGHYHSLAHAMFPHDPAFAAEIATMGGTTLEALGLVKAPLSLLAPPAAGAKGDAVSPAQLDAILCAGAETLDVSPRQLRPALAAAFARASELGLSTATLARAFAASTERKPPVK